MSGTVISLERGRKNCAFTVPVDHDPEYLSQAIGRRRGLITIKTALELADAVAETKYRFGDNRRRYLAELAKNQLNWKFANKLIHAGEIAGPLRDPKFEDVPIALNAFLRLAHIAAKSAAMVEDIVNAGDLTCDALESLLKEVTRPSDVLPLHIGLGEFERNHLYNVECVEAMERLPDHSINLIILDPPTGSTANDWDHPISPELLWKSIKRILKPNGVVAAILDDSQYALQLPFTNKEWHRHRYIRPKEIATNFLNSKKSPLSADELVYVFCETGAYTFNLQMTKGEPHVKKRPPSTSSNYGKCNESTITDNDGLYFPRSILNCPFSTGERGSHETQKPESLMLYLVSTYSNPGELVLDPFAGSGTTAMPCIDLKRGYILFESDRMNYEDARRRIEEHKSEK